MVFNAADRESFYSILLSNTADVRPEPLPQFRDDDPLTLFCTPHTMIKATSVGMRHGNLSFQSSLRDSGVVNLYRVPSDKSLGYYQSSLRDEQPTVPSCKTSRQSTHFGTAGKSATAADGITILMAAHARHRRASSFGWLAPQEPQDHA